MISGIDLKMIYNVDDFNKLCHDLERAGYYATEGEQYDGMVELSITRRSVKGLAYGGFSHALELVAEYEDLTPDDINQR